MLMTGLCSDVEYWYIKARIGALMLISKRYNQSCLVTFLILYLKEHILSAHDHLFNTATLIRHRQEWMKITHRLFDHLINEWEVPTNTLTLGILLKHWVKQKEWISRKERSRNGCRSHLSLMVRVGKDGRGNGDVVVGVDRVSPPYPLPWYVLLTSSRILILWWPLSCQGMSLWWLSAITWWVKFLVLCDIIWLLGSPFQLAAIFKKDEVRLDNTPDWLGFHRYVTRTVWETTLADSQHPRRYPPHLLHSYRAPSQDLMPSMRITHVWSRS